jgi:hypothetical protein
MQGVPALRGQLVDPEDCKVIHTRNVFSSSILISKWPIHPGAAVPDDMNRPELNENTEKAPTPHNASSKP